MESKQNFTMYILLGWLVKAPKTNDQNNNDNQEVFSQQIDVKIFHEVHLQRYSGNYSKRRIFGAF